MEQNIKALLRGLTTQEKLRLISGADFFSSRPVDRLGIPAIRMSDGPHGVRAQEPGQADHLGLNASAAATCFPSGAAIASSWNVELSGAVGRAVAREARAHQIQVMLGPAINLKRSPLCGRNFEYYSEDPYLAGKLAASYIRAMQGEGVAACPKHFACNNQENRRMVSNSVVDQRTLRELYLLPFELAVKEGEPWSIMCAYNALNGTPCSEHHWLLNQVLRQEWGFTGAVISDWGAVSHRGRAAAGGMDLEMPGTEGFSDALMEGSLASGVCSEEDLDLCVEHVLELIRRTAPTGSPDPVNLEEHHELAQRAAEECLILLKNQDHLLPIQKAGKIVVLGALAEHPRYQGGGSSHVASWKVDSTLAWIQALAPEAEVCYEPGYDLEQGDRIQEERLARAEELARQGDSVLVFVGLTEQYETEGSDRKDMKLPPAHNALVEQVLQVCPDAVIVLTAGAPVELPWIDGAKALISTYTGGDGLGAALARILFGDVNPSGKLAETYPVCLEQTPAFLNFGARPKDVRYGEGEFIGYRWYEKRKLPVLFPFGHGLSYTTFDYSNLRVSQTSLGEGDGLSLSVDVKNTGDVAGKEAVQLYVADGESRVSRPVKELKGFAKVALQPGEGKTVTFSLDRRSFAYFDEALGRWRVESGQFELLVGASSGDIRLRQRVTVQAAEPEGLTEVTKETTYGQLTDDPRTYPLICQYLEESPMYRPSEMGDAPDFLRNLPLWTLNHMAGHPITPETLEGYIRQLNQALQR